MTRSARTTSAGPSRLAAKTAIRATFGVGALCAVLLAAAPSPGASDAPPASHHQGTEEKARRTFSHETIGRTRRGRPIVAVHRGDPAAPFKVLVVGSIHGNERQGMRIVAQLRTLRIVPKGIELVTIRTSNPDGTAANTRGNAHGVDLNRNYPTAWDGSLSGGYYSGPAPKSEPETRAIMAFARRNRFDLAIWYHQPWGVTLLPCDSTRTIARHYAQLSGLAAGSGCDGYSPGSAIRWMHHQSRTHAFVVELPARRLRSGEVVRHARAAMQLARSLR